MPKESTQQETYMSRCLDLARLGLGHTAPNPLVGSVIVREGRIIGEGYHQQYGGPHAEVNAVNSVPDRGMLKESVLYVNLEPCSHTGKTPPCADMIIQAGIPEVVIGTSDPNPLVSGNGIKILEQNGVKVTCNVLARECRQLNKRFFTFHICRRPYVVLKWARTSDGFIDIIRDNDTLSKPVWISNEISRMLVHKWRTEEQAILVGTRTAIMDNPRLNAREWPGKSPVRMVIDRELKLPINLNLFDNSQKTLVFNGQKEYTEGQIHYVKLDFSGNVLEQLLFYLYKTGIQSVFVEGGRKLISSFIGENCWDEARVLVGPKKFGEGIPSPEIHSGEPVSYPIREDLLLVYHNQTNA
jgi:diaminohydroxyphosphoribosylaminopyrimidine deaminase/5-amino-6-(5-phosphoribosylamino)uracil reductase